MKLNPLLPSLLLFMLLCSKGYAQETSNEPQKWDLTIETLLQKKAHHAIRTNSEELTEKVGVIVSCENANNVLDSIKSAGYEGSIIDEYTITAKISPVYVPLLAKLKEVTYISGAKKAVPTMHTVRKEVKANQIHSGTNLETPFKGKGVIIGVIDQGFEFRHLSFLDNNQNSRVKKLWDHYNGLPPTENIPNDGDAIKQSHGHATHVTNIAAGSKISQNNFYGIAPEADIIMIPSKFMEDEVLEEANFIKNYALEQQKPFVINMSFGSQIGSHDGTNAYCQAMDRISQSGGVLVAAMGNEADQMIHTQYTFTRPNETVHLIVKKDDRTNYTQLDIWEQTGDGQYHLKAKPFVLNYDGTPDYKNSGFWYNYANFWTNRGQIDPFNHKQHLYYEIFGLDVIGGDFGVELTGNPGDSFHAWINSSCGEFSDASIYSIPGDNEYCVGEAAAVIPSAISVAAYNGNNIPFGPDHKQGDIAFFSSRGPFLGNDAKPTVAAPGVSIISAISKYGDDFEPSRYSVKNNGETYYYDYMSGTSMASPVVTGIIALWLEANPELDYKQIKDIIKKTSTKDQFTGNEWNPTFGHGKINAYEGLKKALELREQSGIGDMLNSEKPFTILTEEGEIRVLFNNDESQASLSVYTTNGKRVKHSVLHNIRRGEEALIPTNDLKAGVYLLNLRSNGCNITRKLLKK